MAKIHTKAEQRRQKLLKDIDAHLKDHPAADTYFCILANVSPYFLPNLRKGVTPKGRPFEPKEATIDKVYECMKRRSSQVQVDAQ